MKRMKSKKPLTKKLKPSARKASKRKSPSPKVEAAPKTVTPKGPIAVELTKVDSDGTAIGIGSGRKKIYRGNIVAWPGKGRSVTLNRTDSHKKRVFKTSKATFVTKDKDDAKVRHIRTENGSRYRLRVV